VFVNQVVTIIGEFEQRAMDMVCKRSTAAAQNRRSLIDSTSRRGQICYTPAFAFDSARAPWVSWLASINDLILIDVEQLTIEHSRISLSAGAMP
jgi:hypothetical protein